MAKSIDKQTDVLDILRGVADGVKAGMVFGTPISQDGVTVLPVARISGGGGAGTGQDARRRESEGAGGGLGLSARPVGVYVIRDGEVTWSPAVDVTRVTLGGQLVGVVALLTLRALFKILRDRKVRRQAELHDPEANATQSPHATAAAHPDTGRKLRGRRPGSRSRG